MNWQDYLELADYRAREVTAKHNILSGTTPPVEEAYHILELCDLTRRAVELGTADVAAETMFYIGHYVGRGRRPKQFSQQDLAYLKGTATKDRHARFAKRANADKRAANIVAEFEQYIVSALSFQNACAMAGFREHRVRRAYKTLNKTVPKIRKKRK